MDLNLSESERTFRGRVRAWLADAPRPDGLRDYGATPTLEDLPAAREWQRTLLDAGFAGLSWPRSHGGTEATPVEQGIWAEETARAGVPLQINLFGPELAGPMIIKFGTEAQQQRFLPKILRAEDIWCQLFSEPEAGSDLARLRTRAEPDGDGWRVHGQKVWTSGAHYADLGLLLARTGGGDRPHDGLTFFLLPMDRPGIEVRPLRQMDGQYKFNEVYFDGVYVGPEDVLGEVGSGWRVAMSTLGRERMMIGANAVRFTQALHDLWSDLDARGLTAGDAVRRRWTDLWSRSQLLRLQWFRVLSLVRSTDDSRTSLLKLTATELERDITVFAQETLGPDLVTGSACARWRDWLLAAPGQTIAGGTSEIQRNIIARRVLGLPTGAGR
ncbi:acyl-CoA dehydrogenase family protein [Mycolicibacterium thermoresistibile]|uniref:Acyl-CoA dehydrogenase n=2 Tax=Mycolicibacterium thermoresistibile TaxID=1797 RepID=G7CH35_MYCT3|nr:acyl-CoA dehydrogenase family protein [Mycolicibacterium thermoresistibile]EHI12145.1 acyl-CoA dehydrogenase [Mycolicibacterium thermoresistibile ATCC 19527]MCV7191140.1 acyl-CoA dehydrogenase family protein [Mycolicibacterium thermoresistibile]SNW16937.1 acyl-CoA dehydrogenase domain-containing protein [Mycolicibacterium thermoresistibile]